MAVEGQPRYLTAYEFERPDVPAGEATPRLEGPNKTFVVEEKVII
jgi:hypothetical protein